MYLSFELLVWDTVLTVEIWDQQDSASDVEPNPYAYEVKTLSSFPP